MLFVSVSGLVVRAAATHICGNGISGLTSPEAAGLPAPCFLALCPPSMESRGLRKIDRKEKKKKSQNVI